MQISAKAFRDLSGCESPYSGDESLENIAEQSLRNALQADDVAVAVQWLHAARFAARASVEFTGVCDASDGMAYPGFSCDTGCCDKPFGVGCNINCVVVRGVK